MCNHEDDFNAQKVYQKLKAHHLTSTKAMIESFTILSYITLAKLGDGTWNGSTESFITNCQNQVRLYEKHVPTTDHFSEGQKKIMLQNAVLGIDELQQGNTADFMSTSSGNPLGYDEYCSLLLAAAVSHDEQYKPKKTKWQVFYHDTHNDEDIQGEDEDQ
jgi:hypothetical protein